MALHRIILADDHPAFMEGVALKLERETDLKIVGRAFNGQDAWDLIQDQVPDLVLIDMDMPELTGLDVVRRVAAKNLDVKMLPLSGHADPEYVMGTLEAGASGYVMKNESLSTIVSAVKSVLSGGVYISPRVSQQIVTRRLHSHNRERAVEDSLDRLVAIGITPRLLKVLRLVGKGDNNEEIGEKLYKSAHTIRNQVDRLKTLSGQRWRPALVAWTWRIGVYDVDQREYEDVWEENERIRKVHAQEAREEEEEAARVAAEKAASDQNS